MTPMDIRKKERPNIGASRSPRNAHPHVASAQLSKANVRQRGHGTVAWSCSPSIPRQANSRFAACMAQTNLNELGLTCFPLGVMWRSTARKGKRSKTKLLDEYRLITQIWVDQSNKLKRTMKVSGGDWMPFGLLSSSK